MRSDDSRPKILVIGPTPPPYNGMSVATQNVLESSLKEQFDLIHLDTADRRGLANVGRLDFTNVCLAIWHFLRFAYLLVVERPQIVYVPIAQNSLAFLRDCLFLIPAKLTYRKVIVHLHGGYFRDFYEESNALLQALIRWTLKDVARAIVLGPELKFVFQGLVPEERIAVVPNGIDARIFAVSNQGLKDSSLGSKKKGYQVLFLGTLLKSKGFIDVLYAIPRVLARRQDVRFVFAGEPCHARERDAAMEFIDTVNLHSFVCFPGVVSGKEKSDLFLSSDMFVLPTYYPYEGQPLVILEAMAAGLPIVTTDQGCIRETVGKGGFIVESGNPRALAERILELLEDDALRERMGRANRDKFLKEYTLETFAENLGRVFREVSLGER